MKKIKIIKSRPLKEEEEVVDQQPQDVAPQQPEITYESNPLEFMLMKYPTLTKTLTDLLTDNFRDYIVGVYIMAPKPTIFKIVLHNNRSFHLIFMGDNKYEAKVSGKKYWLSSVGEFENAVMSIADLLMLGTPPTTQGPETEMASTPEETPAEEEGGEELAEGKLGIRLVKEDEKGKNKVTGQQAETLAVALWNKAIQGVPSDKIPSKYRLVYESLKKYVKEYGVELQKFSGRKIETTPFWKEHTNKSADEPKTDLISVDQKLRLSAKKGSAQLMSAKLGIESEAKATLLAAARTANLNSEVKEILMSQVGRFKGVAKTKTLNTTQLAKADPKKLKATGNIEARKLYDVADKLQQDLQKQLDDLFNKNQKFKEAFVYEALTGQQKFGDSPAEANYVIAFDNDFTKVKIENTSDKTIITNIASKTNPVVAFKSSSYKVKGEKAGYSFFSTIRLMLDDLMANQNKLNEILNTTDLNEDIGSDIWGKIKQAASWIIDKFNDFVNYINDGIKKLGELLKQGLDAALKFLGLTPTVNFNNDIDFYQSI